MVEYWSLQWNSKAQNKRNGKKTGTVLALKERNGKRNGTVRTKTQYRRSLHGRHRLYPFLQWAEMVVEGGLKNKEYQMSVLL